MTVDKGVCVCVYLCVCVCVCVRACVRAHLCFHVQRCVYLNMSSPSCYVLFNLVLCTCW